MNRTLKSIRINWLKYQLWLMNRAHCKKVKGSRAILNILAWMLIEFFVVSSLVVLPMMTFYAFKISSLRVGVVFTIVVIPIIAISYFGSRKLYSALELGPYTYGMAKRHKAKIKAKLKALTDD